MELHTGKARVNCACHVCGERFRENEPVKLGLVPLSYKVLAKRERLGQLKSVRSWFQKRERFVACTHHDDITIWKAVGEIPNAELIKLYNCERGSLPSLAKFVQAKLTGLTLTQENLNLIAGA